jgi:hypothetical protein
MVLTIRVVIAGTGHTRRGVLVVAASAAVAASTSGCSLFGQDPEPERPDALQPVLDEALALAAAFQQAALAAPDLAGRLTPLAADHRAHATELSRVIGRSAPSPAELAGTSAAPTAPAGDAAALLRQLRTSVQAAQRTAGTACRQAPAARAALVGSIAACRATHAEALR